MNTHEELELKKEFQLERIILFSDAVFAIIVTIMVIELKLPESMREASAEVYRHEFMNIYVKLLGYGFSFFFVAMFWMRHVKLFGYLKDYNRTLLVHNLIFLFCISLFPFAVTMITGFNHTNSTQARWGFTVYLFVLMICLFVFTLLTGYLIKNKEKLTFNVASMETDLKWRALRLNYITVPLVLVIVTVMNIMGVRPDYMGMAMGLYGAVTGIATKRMYPKSPAGSKPVIFRMFANRKRKLKKLQAVKATEKQD